MDDNQLPSQQQQQQHAPTVSTGTGVTRSSAVVKGKPVVDSAHAMSIMTEEQRANYRVDIKNAGYFNTLAPIMSCDFNDDKKKSGGRQSPGKALTYLTSKKKQDQVMANVSFDGVTAADLKFGYKYGTAVQSHKLNAISSDWLEGNFVCHEDGLYRPTQMFSTCLFVQIITHALYAKDQRLSKQMSTLFETEVY